MTKKASPDKAAKKGSDKGGRDDRLKAALKANMARRKEQARARKASTGGEQA